MAQADIKQLVQQQFGANAAAYVTSRAHAQGASLARLVDLTQPQADWRMLDIATAAGHTAFVLAPHVAHVTASDITPEMLVVAAGVAADRGITNVAFEQADAEALPFGDATYDLVTCRIAPHHFERVDRFLEEAFRVLKPGGTLAVVDNVVPGSADGGPAEDALRAAGDYVNAFEKLRDPSHHRALSIDEWIDAIQQAGFTLADHETAPKEMEFQPWAERMGATPQTIAELERQLRDAPSGAQEYFAPRVDDGKRYFTLHEAIFLAKKP